MKKRNHGDPGFVPKRQLPGCYIKGLFASRGRGLYSLYEVLKDDHEVFVVAPPDSEHM